MTNFAQLQTKHARKMLSLEMIYLSECLVWLPQLFSWFCTWQICTTTLYGDSWMAENGAQHLLQGRAQRPRSCLPPAWPRLGCSARAALQKDGERETPDTRRPQRHSLRLISSCIIYDKSIMPPENLAVATLNTLLSWGQAGPSASMERKLPTTWEFTFSTSCA